MFRRAIVKGAQSARPSSKNVLSHKNIRQLNTSRAAMLTTPFSGHDSNASLKNGLPAMAFLAALTAQYINDREQQAIECSVDTNMSCNFIADAAAIVSPAVVNVVINVSQTCMCALSV